MGRLPSSNIRCRRHVCNDFQCQNNPVTVVTRITVTLSYIVLYLSTKPTFVFYTATAVFGGFFG